jgi:hypothetical protein
MQLAIFGIDGGALSLVVNLLVLFLIVVYLALIYWTYLDAKRRIQDPVLIACATAASVFPFIGTVVYTILRPPEFLEDREERELELRAAELRLRQLIEQSCPHCEYPIQGNYLRCPNCERRLRNPCRKCSKPLDPKWGICPYCEAEVRRTRTEAGGERPGREGRRADRERRERADRGSERAARQARSERPSAGGQRSSSQRSGSQRSDGSRRTERQPVSGQKRSSSSDGERSSRSSGRVSRPSR